MARGNKANEEKATFKEYDITGANQNDFKGRLYLEAHESEKGARYGLGLTMNGITIKGCKLWVPKDDKKDCSVMFPEYQDKEGKYNPYILILEEKDRKDLTDLANKLAEMLA